MTTLWLLRHGPTAASDARAPLGHLDLPVNEAGQALWPKVRAKLLGLGIEHVRSSDLRRAREHATDLGLPLQVLDGLREQHFGEWDGRPWLEIEEAEAFFADPVHQAPPGGESFSQCAERAVNAIRDVPAAGLSSLLVFAHAGPLRAILAWFLGLPAERALGFAWEPFGLTRLDLYDAGRVVLQFHNRSLA